MKKSLVCSNCDDESAAAEAPHLSQRAPYATTRVRAKKIAFVQTLLFLSLALVQNKLSAQAAATATSQKSTSPSKQASETVLPTETESLVPKEDSSVDLNGNEINSSENWVAGEVQDIDITEVQQSTSVVAAYDEKRYVYREEDSSSRPSQQSEQYMGNDDILIVAAVDGTIAGVSLSTGKTLWSRSHYEQLEQQTHLKTEQEQAEARLFEPLLSTTTTTKSSSSKWRTSAVPSVDGKVFLTAPLWDTVVQDGEQLADDHMDVTVTTTVSDLVARVPFVDKRGRIYTGSRNSIAVAIDSLSGEVLQVVAADSQCSDTAFDDRQVVWLGRVDQRISIQDPRSGNLDVKFSSGQIMSVNDMVLGSGTRQPWNSNDRQSPLLPQEGDGDRRQPPTLLATPNGILAYLSPETGRVSWIAEDFFDSPIAFAVDAASGASLQVNMIPDAAMPNGSNDYLIREIERQLKNIRTSTRSVGGRDEEQTIVEGTLPTSGQLYAMPIGGGPSLADSTGGPAATRKSQPSQAHLGPGTNAKGIEPKAPAHSSTSPSGGRNVCRPGALGFPACQFVNIASDSHRRDPFVRHLDGNFLQGSSPPPLDRAVVPFYDHPDYVYFPPVPPRPNPRRTRHKIGRILGSWLLPTIAFIFVVSFELGRRKRENDHKRNNESFPSDLLLTGVDATAGSNNGPASAGVIQVYDDVILGYGGHGTVVYKGQLDGRQVAVKRMLKTYHASADREISLLIESDGHANVVRYFLKEVRGDFVYLALELCHLSLHDLITTLKDHFDQENRSSRDVFPDATKTILFQIACGVRHLHSLRIVHRDLKPENVLLSARTNKSSGGSKDKVYDMYQSGQYVAKISDMGLGKQLIGPSSYGASLIHNSSLRGQSNGAQSSVTGAGPGSVGWQAPEVMARRLPSSDASVRSDGSNMATESFPSSSPLEPQTNTTRTSRSVDIFSLGCIFYSTLVPGSHPFGEWYEREANIMHNRPSIDALQKLSADAFDLISAMIRRNPSSRPTAQQICEHPFFWSGDRRLTFLCDFSDRLEMEDDEPGRVARLLAVEQGAAQVVGTSWDCDLDDDLVSNVQKFRTYDPSSVRDLLRLIRNKHHHFDELPGGLKEKISESGGLLRYFEARFPNLLIHCFRVCQEMLGKDDSLSIKYSITQTTRQEKTMGAVQVDCEDTRTVDPLDEKEEKEHPPPERKDVVEEELNVSTASVEPEPRLSPEEHRSNENLGSSKPTEQAESHETRQEPEPTEQEVGGPPTSNDVGDLTIWHGSAAAKAFNCRGWNRSDGEWVRRVDTNLRKSRDSNLVRCAKDAKFRTRLCNHWDVSHGTFCPMKKKNKCVFAHGPVQLRVKETKRKRWGKLVDANGDCNNPNHSGGEDTYGAARSIESERKQEGKWNTNKSTGSSKGKPRTAPRKKKAEN